MVPTVTVLDKNLVDVSVKLADDCVFGFTLDRDELHAFITALRDAAFQIDD